MLRISGILTVLALFSLLVFVPESNADKIERYRTDVRKMSNDTLARLYEVQPQAKYVVENAAGYAVFSNVGITFLFAGGGKGSGIAVNNKTSEETFMKMVEGKVGLGLGVKKFKLIFVFNTERALDRFVYKGWEFDTQTTAAAKLDKSGGSFGGSVAVRPDVRLYQLIDDGLTTEITGNVIKFYRDDKLN